MTTNTEIVNANNFDKNVLQSERPVLVDFYADWCGPCKAIKPVLEELAEEFAGRVDIKKVNVDHDQELAQQYGIRGIPTLLVFKEGEVQETLVGLQAKVQLANSLKRVS